MSNNNVPGSNQNVNVHVRALTIDPAVTVQYKTKILHKNVVNGVNTLTQAMMNETNTKYVIKYDYVLGEDITIPANCVLEFDGGSISGEHTINGNSTNIIANTKIFDENVVISIDNFNGIAHTKWFGYKTSSINKTCASFGKCSVVIDSGEYTHDETIIVPYDISIISELATINASIALPVFNIYLGDNPVNLSALKIVLGGTFTGSAVVLYGRRYKNIKGYSYSFRIEQGHTLNVELPYVYGTRDWFVTSPIPESIGYEIYTNDLSSQDPDLYHYIYYIIFNGTCENIKTGCYINNVVDGGTITTNRYNFTFWRFVNAIRLNKPIINLNEFTLKLQAGSETRKYLLVDNIYNTAASMPYWLGYMGPTLNIELMDTGTIPAEYRPQLIDNFPNQIVNITGEHDDILYPGYMFSNKTFMQEGMAFGKYFTRLNNNEKDSAPVIIGDLWLLGEIWENYFDGDKVVSPTNTAAKIHRNFLSAIVEYLNKQCFTRNIVMDYIINKTSCSMDIDVNRRDSFNYILPQTFSSLSAETNTSYHIVICFYVKRYSINRKIYGLTLECHNVDDQSKVSETFIASYDNNDELTLNNNTIYYGDNIGTSAQRPSLNAYAKATRYLDTTLDKDLHFIPSRPGWFEYDNAKAGVLRNGTSINRPGGNEIYVGFNYFDETLGKPIYASAINGSTVTWVDATGTPV